jgi:hypothetical protein
MIATAANDPDLEGYTVVNLFCIYQKKTLASR